MSSILKNCLADFLNDFTRVLSVLSTLHLRLTSSNAELNLPLTDCDSCTGTPVDSSCSSSAEICPLFSLPQPLASDLIALGLPPPMAQYLSGAYIKAAARLKAKFETQLHRADRACEEIRLPEGFTTPRSQPYIRAIYASQFKQMVESWAEVEISSTRRWLLITSLKNRFQVSVSFLRPVPSKKANFDTLTHMDRKAMEAKTLDASHKVAPISPHISIKKTHSAGLASRRSTVDSGYHDPPDRFIMEPTRPALVTTADSDAGLESTQGVAIKGAKCRDLVGKNISPTSWDITSFIHDFDGLHIRDRSKSVGLKDEDGTCKAAPSGHIFTLSKHPSSPIIRLPTPARVQSKASSSRPRNSLQSSYDIHSHSASSQSARRRKFAPCPNRDRSMQSTYKGPDALFSRQTDDMTLTSSVTNTKELSDLTSHRLSPSASSHTRRRKIAPLPPRHLSTTTTDIAVITSPDLRRSSQRPPHKPLGSRQSATGMSGRLTGPLSRSPSLTSHSSDESGLSCSDELETPPSSPSLLSTILPTASSAVSLSPGEYRFLSATFLRTFTFSA
uniref:A2 mating type protein n=1 Tax=Heterobasidion irregulare TaxID=984962 RepID=S5RVV8_9AGAM|nr:a2 mating type protein [Heterobasidion irregulare]